MKKLVSYLVGILVIGWVIASITKLFLAYMPVVTTVFVVAIPIYGVIRKKYQLEKAGVSRLFEGFKKIFKIHRTSWTFYLILGVVIGFVYEDLVWQMVTAVGFGLIGFVSSCLLWESTRLLIKKYKNVEMVSFIEAIQLAW